MITNNLSFASKLKWSRSAWSLLRKSDTTHSASASNDRTSPREERKTWHVARTIGNGGIFRDIKRFSLNSSTTYRGKFKTPGCLRIAAESRCVTARPARRNMTWRDTTRVASNCGESCTHSAGNAGAIFLSTGRARSIYRFIRRERRPERKKERGRERETDSESYPEAYPRWLLRRVDSVAWRRAVF